MITSSSFNTTHSPPSPFTPLTFQSEGHFGEDGITHQTLQTLGLDFSLPCCCWRMWYKKWMEMKGKHLLCPFNIQNVYIIHIYISVNLHVVYFVYYVVYTFDWIFLLKSSLISASVHQKSLSMQDFHCFNVGGLHVSTEGTCKTHPVETWI